MKRGDIIIVELPFTDDSGSKRRPALVVQSDAMNKLVPDTIVASVTSTIHRAATIPTQIIVDPAVETASRLLHVSVVRCENLRAIDQKRILGSIGSLSQRTMKQVDECLRIALGIK